MASNAQNLRDLLCLARLLRGFAEEHRYDANRELFLATAMALEGRAHLMAAVPDCAKNVMERNAALHARVNLLV